MIEDQYMRKHGRKTRFMVIYKNNDIVNISRISYKKEKNKGLIGTVHTKKEYRGRKICQENIKKLIDHTNKKYKITHFSLGTEVDNISAQKCYERVGFKHVDTQKDVYMMELII